MAMGGSISLDRRLLDWEWHDEPLIGWLWVNLLLMANHRDKKWHNIVVKRGQLVTSRDQLCTQTGLSYQQLRTRLAKLVECECIKVEATNKYTVITICKYDSYQTQSSESNQQTTNNQPTINQQSTTNNKENNYLNTHTISAREAAEKKLLDDAFAWGASWLDSVCMKHHLTMAQLTERWKDFKLHCAASDKAHANVQDVREHFNLWLIQTNRNGNNRTTREEQDAAARERRMQEYANGLRAMQAGVGEIQDEGIFD